MADQLTDVPTEDDVMPGEDATRHEIVQRNTINQYAVEVMPLISDPEIRQAWRTAKALAKSRMFKDAYQAEGAFAKILIGRDLGISPTQSLMAIDLVKGAIQLRGVLLASFVRKSDTYHYKVLEKTHEKSRILFLGYPQDEEEDGFVKSMGRWWEVLGEEEFTIEDAKRANLVKPDGAWMAHPKNMCFWRCISNAVKTHAPDLMGGMPVYVEGEIIPEKQIGQGDGNGEVRGLAFGPEVEAVIARAAEMGHAALADRASAEMALTDQPAEKVAEWVAAANTELDTMEPPDAEVVSAEPTDESGVEIIDVAAELQARWDANEDDWQAKVGPLLHRHADLEAQLDGLVAEGDENNAEQVREELDSVESDFDALGVPIGWHPESTGSTTEF